MVGLIAPNGTLINGNDYETDVHSYLEERLHLNIKGQYLASIYVYHYIRVNDGSRPEFSYEVLAELPSEVTNEQIETLTLWLDNLSFRRDFVNIEIEATQSKWHIDHNETNTKFYKRYEFKDSTVDDIIKDIKHYYNSKGLTL